MKKLLSLCIIALLTGSMTACSEDNSSSSEPKGIAEQKEAKASANDPDWITPVGETIETEGGSFTFHARNDKIEMLETGSLKVDFDQVAAISGELSGEFAEYVGVDTLEYIQLDIQVINTSKEPVHFDAYQATVITSTGEEIAMPESKLGTPPEGKFSGEEKKQASIFYVLQKSKAKEVEWVQIIMEAPRDENNEKTGENLDIKVEL